MKTICVSRKSKALTELLKQAEEEDVVVRAADGSEFLLTQIDDFEEEVKRTHRNKKLMAFLDARRKETETIPFHEVQRRLGLASRQRKVVSAGNHRRKN